MHSGKGELVVRPHDIRELFGDRQFDPLHDEPDGIWSVAQIAELTDVSDDAKHAGLRIVLPAAEVLPENEALLRRALARYCARKIIEAGVALVVWRRAAVKAFIEGLLIFAATLFLTAGVQQAKFLPIAFRTLTTESLIVAGWVILWQPMETLLLGWIPIRSQRRRFETLASMNVIVEAVS